MRNFLIVLSIITLVFCFTWNVQAQSMMNIKQATNEVLQDGILMHDFENEFVIFTDCNEQDSLKRGIANQYGWVITTNIGSCTTYVSNPDSFGGVWYIRTEGAKENTGINIQWNNECIKCDSDHVVTFEARIKIDSAYATQSDVMAGFTRRNTAIDSIYDAGNLDGAYFYKKDGALDIWATTLKDTVHFDSTDTQLNLWSSAQASWVKYKILWDGLRFHFTVSNDTLVKAVVLDSSAILPVDELFTPTINILTGSAAAGIYQIDYMVAKSYRRKGR